MTDPTICNVEGCEEPSLLPGDRCAIHALRGRPVPSREEADAMLAAALARRAGKNETTEEEERP